VAVYSKPVHSDLLDGIPRVSVPLLFALLLTVATTLILGIVPGSILASAKAGAYTLTPAAAVESGASAAMK
jgi:NADH-quinone oxidoreductase subunit N